MHFFSRVALLLGAVLPFVQGAPVDPQVARPQPESVPGKYIVLLKSNLSKAQVDSHVADISRRALARRDGPAGVEHTYEFPGFNAYAGAFDDATIAAIKASSDVSPLLPDAWGLC